MRHSKLDLTMSVYTDPKLLDVRGALDTLPTLALDGGHTERESIQATGTEGDSRHGVYLVAPTPDNSGATLSFPGKPAGTGFPNTLAVNPCSVNEKDPLSFPDSGSSCGAEGARTPDLLNAIQTRSQLRHSPN
jgi:hypothetical protein